MPTGNGIFTFNPPSPYTLSGNVANQNPPYVTVTESEGDYSGTFALESCSTTTSGGVCTVAANHQSATCSINGGAQGIEVLQETGYFELAPIVPSGEITCDFVVDDQQGHTATYVVNLN